MSAITYRMPKLLHEELQRAARRRGISQNAFVVESLERIIMGTATNPADKFSLKTLIWISEYLMTATKRDKDDVARLWEIAESKAEALLG
jgi:hypothetical protein